MGLLNVDDFLVAARIPMGAPWCVAWSAGGIGQPAADQAQMCVVKGPFPKRIDIVTLSLPASGDWRSFDGFGFVLAGLVVSSLPAERPWPALCFGEPPGLIVQLWLEQAGRP